MAKTANVIALLDGKGQDASGALAEAKAAEAALVERQKKDHAGKTHESFGLTRPQVANIAKRYVSPAAWELFGDELTAEIWDAL